MTDIDFGIANIQVRSIFDSSKVGLTTGTVRRLGGREYALIRLPSGEMEPLPVMFPIAPIEAQRECRGQGSDLYAVAKLLD